MRRRGVRVGESAFEQILAAGDEIDVQHPGRCRAAECVEDAIVFVEEWLDVAVLCVQLGDLSIRGARLDPREVDFVPLLAGIHENESMSAGRQRSWKLERVVRRDDRIDRRQLDGDRWTRVRSLRRRWT